MPTVAQMASYTLMMFFDTWVLSKVGLDEPTAAGNAGGFAFAAINLGMGVLFVLNALVSQHFGQRDFHACGRYLWQGIWFSIGYSLLLLPVFPLVRPFFATLGHSPELARLESLYLLIVLSASVIKLMSTALGQFLLAINRPNAVLVSAVVGVSVNAVLDWVMVFGHAGFPKMGLAGAAWATNIAVTVELMVLLAIVLSPKARAFGTLNWRFDQVRMGTLLRIGVPSGFQIVTEVLAWSLFGAWAIGLFGTTAMAANTYMMRYMILSFMPCFGIATAVTALVGRYIGMGRPDLAARRAHLGFVLTAGYTACCGLFFLVAREPLLRFFTGDPAVIELGKVLMIFAAAYVVFDAMYIVYCGALRGAGDTFVPAVATGVLCWTIALGGGLLLAWTMPQWSAAGPWAAATVYGILLGCFMLVRFNRGRWRAIRLEDQPPEDKLRGFEVISGPTIAVEKT